MSSLPLPISGPRSGLVLIGVLAFACTVERADVRTPSGEPPAADTTRVRATIETLAAAFEAGDMQALDSIIADSSSFFEDGRVAASWPDYRQQMLTPQLNRLTERRLRFDDIDVTLAGRTAWATAAYALEALHDGEPVSRAGVATMIFRKRAGSWWLVHVHSSRMPSLEGGS